MGDHYIFGKHHAFGHTIHHERMEYEIKWWACDFRPEGGIGRFNKHDLSVIKRGAELLGGHCSRYENDILLGKDMVSIEQWHDKYPAPVLWAQFADTFRNARPMDFRVAPFGWSCPVDCPHCDRNIGDVVSCPPHGPKWERLWRPLSNGTTDWHPFLLGYDVYPDKIEKPRYFRLDARATLR